MNPPFSNSDFEDRLDAWLSAKPLTPPSDFVARTIKRIHEESALLATAKAGDEAAIDALLDRWLAEQPLAPEADPEQIVIHARRAATREEQEEARPTEAPLRRTIIFPAWIRSVGTLAAAAAVALIAYFGSHGLPGNLPANAGPQVAQNVSTPAASINDGSIDTPLPDKYTWAYDSKALIGLNDSLRDGAALLNSDDVDMLVNAEQDNGEAAN